MFFYCQVYEYFDLTSSIRNLVTNECESIPRKQVITLRVTFSTNEIVHFNSPSYKENEGSILISSGEAINVKYIVSTIHKIH